MKTAIYLAVALLAGTTTSVVEACDYDVDCEPGSKCRGNVCVDGLWPGNDNDDAPLRRRDRPVWDLNESYGNTCAFDIDCGVGMRCLKGSGTDGVCVRGR